jgi:hypothetical protein
MNENLRMLAKKGNDISIYEAGDSWFHQKRTPGQEKEFFIPKAEKPMYPLAACIKWGFEPTVNEEELAAICEEVAKSNRKP